jgi:hypothetical protein
VIDLRFLVVKSSSYRAHSFGLSGSSHFRRGKNHDLLFHEDSNAIQDARGARAPGLRPLGPIPYRPSLGCPRAAIEPFDEPAFELPIFGVWSQRSGVESRGAARATGRVRCRRRDRRVVVAQPPSARVEWLSPSPSPRARGPSLRSCSCKRKSGDNSTWCDKFQF